MGFVFLGAIVLVLLIWALHGFAKADPRKLVPIVRTSGGIGALAGAAFLVVRGQVGLALPLGVAGLSLLGWLPGAASFGRRTQRTTGQVSRVRTQFVEMELDHDSGAMRGRIVAGRHEGVPLEALDIATLAAFAAEIDDESRALLAAYLDRREPGWREHAQADAATGRGSARSAKMTEQEAYEILGLQPGASVQDIGRAHRALMKKLHPDQGGSTYLAARVNEAKDVLLRGHR
ncbi:MAG: DnaJ domain-containing protein [Pseudorhodoplanes sp.]|nr:hypothetical protein [Pseudorhodoplanes sp.]MBW7949424.1 DnaJ domain-containing protein [Pseudorhodoplanes sp.]GIK82244.1 MAG: molecular chaperone DnaJ [Alphaproteobacteria bacterium]